MGAFDALFGRLFGAGVELELKNGINFADGLDVTETQSTDGAALWTIAASASAILRKVNGPAANSTALELWLNDGVALRRISQTVATRATTAGNVATTVVTLAMPASTTFSLAIRWHGRDAAGNELLRESSMVFRRVVAAAPAQWGSTVDIFPTTKDDGAWGAPGVVVSSNNLLVQVTGKAATSITWDVEATWRDL